MIEAYAPVMPSVVREALGERVSVVLDKERGMLHDDVESAAALALVQAAESWEPSKGAFGTWLRWRVRWAALDALRKAHGLGGRADRVGAQVHSLETVLNGMRLDPTASRDLRIAAEALTDWARPNGASQASDERREVARVLADLPTDQIQVVCMYHIENMTMDEIGEELGIDRRVVGKLLRRARREGERRKKR